MFSVWIIYTLPVIYLYIQIECVKSKPEVAKLPDCRGVVGFSAVGALTVRDTGILSFKTTFLNYENSFVNEVGTYTCQCPGLYQVTFTGVCETNSKLVLKKRDVRTSSWSIVVTTPMGCGSNSIVYRLELGEQLALFVQGSPPRIKYETNPAEPYTSFSAFRLQS